MNGAPPPTDRDWFSRERVLAITLAIATLLSLHVCYLIVKPFIPALAFALALVVATHKPHAWLGRRLNNNTLTAAIAVILVALVIIAPLTALLTYIVRQIVQTMRNTEGGGLPLDQWSTVIHGAPVIGDAIRWLEETFDIPAQLGEMAKNIASQAGGLLAGSVSVLTQLVVMLFVLFFLYRDGREARAALRRLVPLSDGEASDMFAQIRDTIVATVNGSLTVALVQSVLAGIMYTILAVPASIVWGAATFIAALIPVFGTFMIWGPVAAYLAITGSWVKALVLVGWGVLAIGMIDNILYPYLVGDKLRLHTVPTFFAILGGVGLFGPSGLILGPVTLAITIGLLQIWWTRTSYGGTAEETIRAEPTEAGPVQTLTTDR